MLTSLVVRAASEKSALKKQPEAPTGEVHTLAEIADKLGVSRERVRQIESVALAKLRAGFLADPILRQAAENLGLVEVLTNAERSEAETEKGASCGGRRQTSDKRTARKRITYTRYNPPAMEAQRYRPAGAPSANRIPMPYNSVSDPRAEAAHPADDFPADSPAARLLRRAGQPTTVVSSRSVPGVYVRSERRIATRPLSVRVAELFPDDEYAHPFIEDEPVSIPVAIYSGTGRLLGRAPLECLHQWPQAAFAVGPQGERITKGGAQ